MAYTNRQWKNVLAYLRDQGGDFSTPEGFVEILREVEAIKPIIVSSGSHDTRDYKRVLQAKADADQAVIDLQDELDNHPGKPQLR